ncbi:hypothetical protein EXE41_06455 [Halorubrum sp. SD690R]|nr:hypothetical protein EXE41_06455 [Halorubrum sp. SD690R]
MSVARQYNFVSAVLAWSLASLFILVATGWLTYELFFVISLIGVLIVVEFTSPVSVRPRWRKRVRWIILIGIAGFLVVLARRTVAVLPPEVV